MRVSSTSSRIMARSLPIIMVLALVGTLPAIAEEDTFGDDNSSPHEADIEFIASRGITIGCNPPSNDRYCPDRPVTRGEMAAYLARSAKVPLRANNPFVDAQTSVFAHEIALIARAGITLGCNPPNNDRYCPDAQLTRGQMAAFIVRAFDLPSATGDYFGDDAGSVFESDINALAQGGITVGCGTGRYCPDAAVTRAQMASFMKRALTGGVAPPPPGDQPPEPPPSGEPPATLPPPGDSPPPGAVHIQPGQSLASAVASHPAGATFYLTEGVHRMVKVRPKDRNVFVGAPGAIVSGARLLSGFKQSGGLWYIGGQTQENEKKGTCIEGYTGCVYPEQLFLDGKELWQVTSKSQLKAGTWFFDYGQDTIWIADDPRGRVIETSVVPVAFDGSAHDVTIRDLTIEKYATPGQMGAIHGQTDRNGAYGHGWTVKGNEIRYNASEGVALGHSMVVEDNYIHHNGRTGVAAGFAEKATIVRNEISYNCRGTGYLCFGWGGGGVKIAGAKGTMMRNNHVRRNYGAGLHSDVQASDTSFVGNTVVDNDGPGIFVEVSNGALVANNLVVENGFERPEGRGAGIVISASVDVDVSGNHVIDNALGIVAYHHDRSPGLDRLSVMDNLVVMDTDGHNGLRNKTSAAGYFDGRNVVWNSNVYELSTDSRAFVYDKDVIGTSAWLAAGYDKNSAFR